MWLKRSQVALAIIIIILIMLISISISCMGIYTLGSVITGVSASSIIGDIKNLGDILQAFATIGAIIFGGIWSLILFQWRRERLPRASIEHQVTAREIQGGNLVLHVSIIASNLSQVLLHCKSLTMWIQQVLPPDKEMQKFIQDYIKNKTATDIDAENLIPWPAIAIRKETWDEHKKELEPGESHQFWFDFIIPSDVKIFRLYSFLTEFDNPKIGWSLASIHEIDPSTKVIKSEFTKLISSKPE
jgi:hypothetical protein